MIDFCKIKEIQKALNSVEDYFKSQYGIGINEASVLCSLSQCCMTSSEIAKCADLKASHTSKTIRSIENKKLIKRKIGTTDKRIMRFTLTQQGKALLEEIKTLNIEFPDILKPVFDSDKHVTSNI